MGENEAAPLGLTKHYPSDTHSSPRNTSSPQTQQMARSRTAAWHAAQASRGAVRPRTCGGPEDGSQQKVQVKGVGECREAFDLSLSR